MNVTFISDPSGKKESEKKKKSTSNKGSQKIAKLHPYKELKGENQPLF